MSDKVIRRTTPEQAKANIAALFTVGPKTAAPTAEGEKWEPGSHFSPGPLLPPENGDRLAELPILLLDDFSTGTEQQPFRPYTAEELEKLRDDIVQRGILQPPIVRPKPNGRYEIIAGHNRRTGARMAGYTTIPCIVRALTDDEAILQMISTNLRQRKKLLASEKAKAYQMRMEAMKRQGYRSDLTPTGTLSRFRSDELLGEEVGESRETIRLYIRLNYLTEELLRHVDEGKLGLNAGATLSYISRDNQEALERYCFVDHHLHISQELADALRQADADGSIFSNETLPLLVQLTVKAKGMRVSQKVLRRYFNNTTSRKAIDKTVDVSLKEHFSKGGTICE